MLFGRLPGEVRVFYEIEDYSGGAPSPETKKNRVSTITHKSNVMLVHVEGATQTPDSPLTQLQELMDELESKNLRALSIHGFPPGYPTMFVVLTAKAD